MSYHSHSHHNHRSPPRAPPSHDHRPSFERRQSDSWHSDTRYGDARGGERAHERHPGEQLGESRPHDAPLIPPQPAAVLTSTSALYARMAARAGSASLGEGTDAAFSKIAAAWLQDDGLRVRIAEQTKEQIKQEATLDQIEFELKKAQFKLAQAERRYEVASADLNEIECMVEALAHGEDLPETEWMMRNPNYMSESYTI